MTKTKELKKFQTLDVTRGPILAKMIRFAIPIFLSGILQQAFTTADSVVVGRFAGSNALAGISATSSLVNLLVNFFMGLSAGAMIAISQHTGAADREGVRNHAHNAIATSLVCGIFVAIFGNIICRPMLEFMDTPKEIIDYSEKYLRIYFAGVPAILLYNYGSAIMRTMGDTKRPIIYLAVGGAANVILNLFFVLILDMDVDGVAIATVVSNIISSIFVINNLCHSTHDCRINIKDIKLRKKEFKRIMSLGLPSGVQSAMFSISNIVMQSSINSFGSEFVAGNAAAANIDHYNDYLGSAFVNAAVTFSGQNFGAGNYKRIKKIFIEGILCVCGISVFVSSLIITFREPLARLFITDSEYAIEVAGLRNIYVGGMYALCALMGYSSANIRALGKSFSAMMVTVVVACFGRILWVYTVFANFRSPHTLYIVYPVTWAIASIINIIMFAYYYKQMKTGKLKMGIK